MNLRCKVFDPGMPFQLTVMFAGKDRAYLSEAIFKR
jgi:hypothetical protein